MTGFRSYVELYVKDKLDEVGVALKVVHESVNERWEVCLTMSEKGFQQISFVNSIATTKVTSPQGITLFKQSYITRTIAFDLENYHLTSLGIMDRNEVRFVCVNILGRVFILMLFTCCSMTFNHISHVLCTTLLVLCHSGWQTH